MPHFPVCGLTHKYQQTGAGSEKYLEIMRFYDISGEALAELVQKISCKYWLQLGLQYKNTSVTKERKVSHINGYTSPDNSCLA